MTELEFYPSHPLVPWERLPEEGSMAFQAFCAYRDLGPDRKISKAAELVGKAEGTLKPWSSQYGWVERAHAYDDECDRKARAELEDDRLAMRKRHIHLAQASQIKIAQRLGELDPSELSPKDLMYWLEVSVKIERAARGEPDVKMEMTGKGGGAIEIDSMDTDARRAMLAAAVAVAKERLGYDLVAGQPIQGEIES